MIFNMQNVLDPNGVEEQAKKMGLLSERAYIKKHERLLESYDNLGFITNSYAPAFESDYLAACTAVLMENTRKVLVPESDSIEHAFEIAKRAIEMGLGEATTPTLTTAWSGATTLPMVLGMIRKIMPRLIGIQFLAQVQPLDRPTGRVFFLNRVRHDNGTDVGDVENRAGWSYRSWIDDPGEATAITKSFRLSLSSKNVSVGDARKFKVETSIEVEQDLRAYFGLDAVALISDAGADELAAEIDEYIIHKLWATGTGPTVYYGARPSAFNNDPGAWDQRIIEALERTSELIYSKKRIRPNRVVIGSEFSIYLKRLRQFQSVDTNRIAGDQSVGVQRVGTLDNQWTVLQMPLPFPTSTAMLSYQGDSPMDGTFIWMPYIPLMRYVVDLAPGTMVRTISWLRRDTDFTVDKGYVGLSVIDETNFTGLSYPAYTEYVGTHETSGGDVS